MPNSFFIILYTFFFFKKAVIIIKASDLKNQDLSLLVDQTAEVPGLMELRLQWESVHHCPLTVIVMVWLRFLLS